MDAPAFKSTDLALPPLPGFDRETEQKPLDLFQYWLVVLKHKWGILSVALLAGLIGIYMAYKAVPIYQSRVTLQIEREGGPTIGNLLNFPIYQQEFYQTQYELIRSWSVAEIAAERLGLGTGPSSGYDVAIEGAGEAGSSVTDLVLSGGPETLEGTLLDADDATRIYEDIVRAMRDPGLLEYAGQDMFRARVYPIPARGRVRIELAYEEAALAEIDLDRVRRVRAAIPVAEHRRH